MHNVDEKHYEFKVLKKIQFGKTDYFIIV